MATYTPPLRDMQFVMHELFGYEEEFRQLPAHAEVNRELMTEVLEQGGKFAAEVVYPLNRVGDVEGCRHDPATGAVVTPASTLVIPAA